MNSAPIPAGRFSPARRQRGAALVVGLVLLMVLTLLAISGMNTATVELQMAGNLQYAQNAFQAAETGIERTIQATVPDTTVTANIAATLLPGSTVERYQSTVHFDAPNAVTAVPAGGFSMGSGTGFSAYHFDVTTTGTSARDARAVNTQSFYIVGPSGS
jgi:type IV pilus assembly protein PilX